MTRASFEAQARYRPGEIPFSVTRAGCPGIQRYAQTWSGDNTTSWATLRWNIRTGLQMSLSGMFNVGHDVGCTWRHSTNDDHSPSTGRKFGTGQHCDQLPVRAAREVVCVRCRWSEQLRLLWSCHAGA